MNNHLRHSRVNSNHNAIFNKLRLELLKLRISYVYIIITRLANSFAMLESPIRIFKLYRCFRVHQRQGVLAPQIQDNLNRPN